MAKFLRAKTVLRSYHHLTKELVEAGKKTDNARREVQTLVGTLYFNNILGLQSSSY